jgi:hypothetical protein
MRVNPGPLVAVMARRPPRDAPMHAARLAISSSICTNTPPTRGSSRAISSATSEEGVMGYPA